MVYYGVLFQHLKNVKGVVGGFQIENWNIKAATSKLPLPRTHKTDVPLN